METVQIRPGLKFHLIEKGMNKPLCGVGHPLGFNNLLFEHDEDCECLNCRRVMEARERRTDGRRQ
jgi:hypothetical protein